jgi:hypothetical protein
VPSKSLRRSRNIGMRSQKINARGE